MRQRTACTSFSDCSSSTTKNKAKAKINSQPLTSLIIRGLFLHQIANQWHLTCVEDISTTRSKLGLLFTSSISVSSLSSNPLIIRYHSLRNKTTRVLNTRQHKANETWYLHLLLRHKWPNLKHFILNTTNRKEVRKRLQNLLLKWIDDKSPDLDIGFLLSILMKPSIV